MIPIHEKVCQWLATGQQFSIGTTVSSTNKTVRLQLHDITEILLKVAFSTHIMYRILFIKKLLIKRRKSTCKSLKITSTYASFLSLYCHGVYSIFLHLPDLCTTHDLSILYQQLPALEVLVWLILACYI